MSESDDFRRLLDACRAGDANAFDELVRRYKHHVRTAVKNRLSAHLRVRFDSHDFTQDVWASFFLNAIERLDQLPDEKALIAYLAQMARNKVGAEFRHQNTLKVGIGRNTPLDAVGEPRANAATPSAEVIADEQWTHLISGLTERERKMLTMIREGQTHSAIAQECGLSEKTVQRLVARVERRYFPDS